MAENLLIITTRTFFKFDFVIILATLLFCSSKVNAQQCRLQKRICSHRIELARNSFCLRRKFVFVSNRKHCFIEPNSTIFSVTDKTVDTPQKAFNDLLSGNKDKAIKRKSPGLKKNDIIEIFIFAKEGLTEAVHKKLHETARKHGADIDRILEQVQRRDDVEDNLEEFANQVCKSTDDVDSMLLDLYEVINQCYTDFGMEKVPPDIKKEINDLRIDGDRAVANAIFLWWDYDNPNDVSELVDEIHFRRFDGFWMICTEKEWKSGRSNKGK